MPLARINGVELYYEVHGEGPALVLAHGAGGNHLSWWQQVPALSRFFRCITFDHRCFGYSRDLPGGPGPKAFVDDLRALLDHLEIDRAALVAQSMGGWTSLGFANTYPDRTAALVLCDTTAGMDDAEVREQGNLSEATRGGMAQILTQVCAPDFPRRDPARYFLYQQISALNIHVPVDLLPALLAIRYRVDNIIAKRIPTTLIVGGEDTLTPPRVMETMARRLGNAPLIRVADAGHSVYFEKPDEFNRAVLDFLQRR